MIKTLSPYMVTIPLINALTGVICEYYTIKLFIWEGSKNIQPLTPEYEITKINAALATGSEKVDIARIINDYINFTFDTQDETGTQETTNQVWTKYEIYYNDTPGTPSIQYIDLAIKGYGYYMEGENPQPPANRIMLRGTEFKVFRGGSFVLPVLAGVPTVATRTLVLSSVDDEGDNEYSYVLTPNFTLHGTYIRAREVGDSDWIYFEVTVLGFVTIDISEPFEMQAVSFDNVTNQYVYSNIVTVS